jgi:hypothetical protein
MLGANLKLGRDEASTQSVKRHPDKKIDLLVSPSMAASECLQVVPGRGYGAAQAGTVDCAHGCVKTANVALKSYKWQERLFKCRFISVAQPARAALITLF